MKNIYYTLFLLFLLPATVSFGQFTPEEQLQLDSFNTIIRNPESHDTSLVQVYVGLSEILYISNIDTLLPLCTKAKIIAKRVLATDPPSDIQTSINTSLAGALNNLGYIYRQKGDIGLALEYYHESLKIYEEIEYKKGMASSYNNIGLIHKLQGNIPLALEHYHKSLKIRKEINNKKGIANSYINIGTLHSNQGELALALEYYHKSLKIRGEIGDKRGMAECYTNIGLMYKRQGDIELALAYYHKSLKIKEDINDKDGLCYSLNSISSIALEQGKITGSKGALALALKSFNIAIEIGFPANIRNSSQLLSEIYEKQGNGMKALEMHKLYFTMRDSLNNESTLKAAAQQNAKYEYQKQKALDDAAHDKLIAVEKEEKEKQQILTYASFGGAGFILVFLIFVFNRLKITRKQKVIIEETNEELNQTNEELAAQRDHIEEKNNDIIASITYAKRIQDALLKNEEHDSAHLPPHFVLFQPKDIVSGDFYWALEKQGHLYLAAVDCTGHGVPGAFLTMLGTSFLSEINSTPDILSPSVILDKLRDKIVKELASDGNTKDGMDISLMRLDLKTNKLEWSGANNPLYVLSNNEMEVIKGDRESIGYTDNPTSFTSHSIKLNTGDQIYLFTDGYADQFGGDDGKKMGYKSFREKLVSVANEDMATEGSISHLL